MPRFHKRVRNIAEKIVDWLTEAGRVDKDLVWLCGAEPHQGSQQSW